MTLFRRLGSRGAKPNPDAFWSDKWGWMDETNVADLVAALQEEGVGEVVKWCETHGHSAPPCGARMNCNIVPVLVVRIDGETP